MYRSRAHAWSATKEFDKAIADYTEAIRLDRQDAWTYLDRGLAWSDKNDADKAIADYGEAIRLNPSYSWSYYYRGRQWERKKNYGQALADYAEATRLDPKDVSARNSRAWLLATCSDGKYRDGVRAVELAKQAVALDTTKMSGLLDTLAAAYAETGDFKQAVHWQERALQDARLANDASAKRRLELYRHEKPYRQH
jgi:tetratricopeptide (TPR) repeat protein